MGKILPATGQDARPAFPIKGIGGRHSDIQIWRDALTTAVELPAETRALLFILGQYMNPDGTHCFPGRDWLCAATGRTDRWIRDHAARAIAAGYLARVEGTGHHGSNTEYAAMIPIHRLVPADEPGPDGRWPIQRRRNGDARISTEAFNTALTDARRRNERAANPTTEGGTSVPPTGTKAEREHREGEI